MRPSFALLLSVMLLLQLTTAAPLPPIVTKCGDYCAGKINQMLSVCCSIPPARILGGGALAESPTELAQRPQSPTPPGSPLSPPNRPGTTNPSVLSVIDLPPFGHPPPSPHEPVLADSPVLPQGSSTLPAPGVAAHTVPGPAHKAPGPAHPVHESVHHGHAPAHPATGASAAAASLHRVGVKKRDDFVVHRRYVHIDENLQKRLDNVVLPDSPTLPPPSPAPAPAPAPAPVPARTNRAKVPFNLPKKWKSAFASIKKKINDA